MSPILCRFATVSLAMLTLAGITACSPNQSKNPAIAVDGNRAVVSVPNCPDWSNPHRSNFNNGTFSNFGCAHATNLVKMVEDPADLVAPDATGHANGERNAGVVQQYRASGSESADDAAPTTSGTTSGGS